jgi:hypothetical protein
MNADPLLATWIVVLVLRRACEREPQAGLPAQVLAALGAFALQGLLLSALLSTAAPLALLALLAVLQAQHAGLLHSLADGRAARAISLVATLLLLAVFVGDARLQAAFRPELVEGLGSFAARQALLAGLDAETMHGVWVWLAALWIGAVEINPMVGLALKRVALPVADPSHPLEPARGRLIGLLERALVVGLALADALGSLGLLLAAKAFARFKDLDRRDFAEYVLIGTLLSVGAALAVGLAFRALL